MLTISITYQALAWIAVVLLLAFYIPIKNVIKRIIK